MDRKMPPAVDWSCHLYAALFAILPGSFRKEYDQPIRQAFCDLCLDAWQARGPLGLVTVWMHALPDLADGAAGEWQLALASGGSAAPATVPAWLLLAALVGCAVLLALMVVPDAHSKRLVALPALAAVMAVAVSAWRARHRQRAAPGGHANELGAATPAGAPAMEDGPGNARLLRNGLFILEWVFLGLLLYVLFVLFPAVAGLSGPRRVLPSELTLPAYGFSLRLTAMILVGAYLAATAFGTCGREPGARPWVAGVTAGGAAGVAALSLSLASQRIGQVQATPGVLLVMFASAVVAGLIAGRLTGQTEAGALGGFWCGLACALVWATGGMALDLALAYGQASTAWAGPIGAGGPGCMGPTGTALAACAVSGDLHTWGLVLLALPILGGGLGAIGGLFGASIARPRLPEKADWGRALVVPVGFSGVMVLLLAAHMVHLLA